MLLLFTSVMRGLRGGLYVEIVYEVYEMEEVLVRELCFIFSIKPKPIIETAFFAIYLCVY